MIRQIQDVLSFHSQKWHVPVVRLPDSYSLQCWDRHGLAVALPEGASTAKNIADMLVGVDREFGKDLGGDLITCDEVPVARVGKQWLVVLITPKNPPALAFVRKLIDQHIPRLARAYKHEMRDLLVNAVTNCVIDRKRELQSSIREDSYELERQSLQLMQLSRKLEGDRAILKMFEKPDEYIKARTNRSFCDLLKLVPGVYREFKMDGDSIIGTTYEIVISYEGYDYRFDEYQVEVDLRQGKIYVTGGSNVNGYVHPHVSDESSNICWGNIGPLVQRLIGQMDLFPLFQLVHTFLASYNSSDPFQRIEKWDPDWQDESDDDEPYCSFCDDYGHTISECDSCWWCEHCNEYVDHDEEDCPNRPKEEVQQEDNAHAMAEA
jgi:hypothetical protein